MFKQERLGSRVLVLVGFGNVGLRVRVLIVRSCWYHFAMSLNYSFDHGIGGIVVVDLECIDI